MAALCGHLVLHCVAILGGHMLASLGEVKMAWLNIIWGPSGCLVWPHIVNVCGWVGLTCEVRLV